MKKILAPILIIALLFVGCSQDEEITSNQNANLEKPINARVHCVYTTVCDSNYVFPIRSGSNYDCFTVTYNASLSLAEIQCVRYNYFNCFPLLTLDPQQPLDPYQDDWCYLNIGRPLKSLSKTIISDPRLH